MCYNIVNNKSICTFMWFVSRFNTCNFTVHIFFISSHNCLVSVRTFAPFQYNFVIVIVFTFDSPASVMCGGLVFPAFSYDLYFMFF